jgi:hypothetical protein
MWIKKIWRVKQLPDWSTELKYTMNKIKNKRKNTMLIEYWMKVGIERSI